MFVFRLTIHDKKDFDLNLGIEFSLTNNLKYQKIFDSFNDKKSFRSKIGGNSYDIEEMINKINNEIHSSSPLSI